MERSPRQTPNALRPIRSRHRSTLTDSGSASEILSTVHHPVRPMPSTLASVELCLACSASLPPRKSGSKVFFTQCCSRPICPNCLYTNPRLVRYNPCLRCLAGVNAVNTTSSTAGSHIHAETVATARKNVDGSVRDEDIFVVDDEESDSDFEDESDNSHSESEHIQRKPASETIQEHSNPPHINGATAFHTLRSDSALSAVPRSSPEVVQASVPDASVQATAESPGTPPRYFIRPEDTLLGISLKLGIDVSPLSHALAPWR